VVTKLLPQCLLLLGIVEVGRWRAGVLPPLLRACKGATRSGEGGTGRRGSGAMRR
jgi:hypothetical protein